MYTLLRVGKNYDKSKSYVVADWSDSTIDTLSASELQKCLSLGLEIEGVSFKNGKIAISPEVPKVSGSDTISVLADSYRLGTIVCIILLCKFKKYTFHFI